ncbi:hypothetical protein HYALB_00006090 [Hymenoscyphus albidus]|uniref:Uncharacterized protein n=1 Tax=Hymenoscyphus albidus TaxID=595503 RepID=A0A9N9M2T2_9HELO|nr:hypothetical protein HYALB_00006090 [Hymenoscyphus albidus]
MRTTITIPLTLLSLLTLVTAQCRNLMPVAAQTVSSSEPDRVFPNVAPGDGQTGTVIITDNSDLFHSDNQPGIATFHAYTTNKIANRHNAAINALLWDGSLARKQVPCPTALPGVGFGEAYFGMELNIFGLGGVIPGKKHWSLSETGGEGGVWNGVFMQVDC